MAILAWNALHNGQGGLDWAGLEAVSVWLGVEDLERLLNQLLAIKTHRKSAGDEDEEHEPE